MTIKNNISSKNYRTNPQFLVNIWISIEFNKNVIEMIDDCFEKCPDDKYYGEWELNPGGCYHLYFYEFVEEDNILYLDNGLLNDNNHRCNCLMEFIQSHFRGVNFKVKYH